MATLHTERIELEIDLEKDCEESKERYSGTPDEIRVDQDFWRTEIYKYEFCIEEIERLIKLIE